MRWPDPSVFGNAAQWASAAFSFGALALALYGINKAVPFFANLNLREANARLQIDLRGLDDEKRRYTKELEELRSEAQDLDRQVTTFTILANCLIISGGMANVLNDANR